MALVRGEELLVEPRATAGDEDFELQWQRIERGERGTSCCYDPQECESESFSQECSRPATAKPWI